MNLPDQFSGKKNLQKVFERLYSMVLKGMNYGRASDYHHNGEAQVIDTIRHRVSSSSAVLFDVGANRGVFVKHLMAAWQGMNYQLYAFEPSKKAFTMLRDAIPNHSFVHLINKGLSQKPESVELFFDKEGSGLASVYPRDLSSRQLDFSSHETVELTTLDLFCEQNKIAYIDFLKMDVEGHEMAVLKGGERMIRQGKVGIVQFEFGGCNIDSRTFFRDYYNFLKDDFDLFRILSNGLRPITAYNERLEIFLSANYLAIRKGKPA